LKRLIVSADDFGKNHAANAAIFRAFREGILKSASLMIEREAAADAVEIARANPSLAVGLHLEIVTSSRDNPLRNGWRYWKNPDKLRAKIVAQLEKFAASGLPLAHVDGHIHYHLHPRALDILLELAPRFGIRTMRLPREPLLLNLRLSPRNFWDKTVHAAVFGWLTRRAAKKIAAANIRTANFSFGTLEYAKMTEEFVLKLLENLPDGASEIYFHPEIPAELDALCSPRVRDSIKRHGIQLISWRDLL
jgi:hopanoid biosynthesis associated protein HpnK